MIEGPLSATDEVPGRVARELSVFAADAGVFDRRVLKVAARL
jgi:streptomycin 6-kinase